MHCFGILALSEDPVSSSFCGFPAAVIDVKNISVYELVLRSEKFIFLLDKWDRNIEKFNKFIEQASEDSSRC